MLRSSFLFLFVCCFLLWGCSEEEAPFSGDGVAVSFSTDIAVTSSSATRVTGDVWDDNDVVGIYMVSGSNPLANNANQLRSNVKYAADQSGGSTTGLSNADGSPIVFPNSGTDVSFYAYYPYNTAFTKSTLTRTVDVSDQSNPAAIDLLWCKTDAYSQSNPTVSLPFTHQMCKLVIEVVQDGAFTDTEFAGLSVALTGTNTKATFSVINGAFTSPATKTSIKARGPLKVDGKTVYEIIFIPHAATTGRTLAFTIGGSTYLYPILNTQPFDQSTKYTCKFTVNKTIPVLTHSSISAWTGAAIVGNSEQYLKVSDTSISLPLTADSGTITAYTDASSTSVSVTVPSWMSYTRSSKQSGSEYEHVISYTHQATTAERSGNIKISHVHGPSISVNVKQAAGSGSGGSISTHVSNCYILNPVEGNTIYIPVSRANEFEEGAITTTFQPRILWWQNSYGSSSPPVSVNKSGDGADGYIVVTSTGLSGNAVVTAEVGGTVKWSWHIWCTNTPGSYEVGGYRFMDRNLGAMSNTIGSGLALGLLYQWGRKDPFSNTLNIYNLGEPAVGGVAITTVTLSKTLQCLMSDAVNFPTEFYCNASQRTNKDWESKGDTLRWGRGQGKTLFDPCPTGWRVPDKEALTAAVGDNDVYTTDTEYGIRDKCWMFWPNGPYRDRDTASLTGGNMSAYWSNTASGYGGHIVEVINGYGGVNNWRAMHLVEHCTAGASVRCVSE